MTASNCSSLVAMSGFGVRFRLPAADKAGMVMPKGGVVERADLVLNTLMEYP